MWQDTEIFSTVPKKKTADTEGDQSKGVYNAKSRKGLEFFYHKEEEEEEQKNDKRKKITRCVEQFS